MEKGNDIYAGKIELEDRLLLLICGVCCFPIGIALYYFFKDKKKEYYAKFAKMGATAGMCITFILILLGIFIGISSLLAM